MLFADFQMTASCLQNESVVEESKSKLENVTTRMDNLRDSQEAAEVSMQKV